MFDKKESNMTSLPGIPQNLIEIIPYIKQGDLEIARKHLAVYRRETEKRIRVFSGKSSSPDPDIQDLNKAEASLSGQWNAEKTIQALKIFDANFCAFLEGIPLHIYKKQWKE